MINFLDYSILINNTHLQLASLFGSNDISYQEVSAILGITGILAGLIIKIFYKPDDKIDSRLLKLEAKFLDSEIENKERLKELREQMIRLEDNISEDRDRDNQNRDKAIEKIENKIERLSDYIMKLIEKL